MAKGIFTLKNAVILSVSFQQQNPSNKELNVMHA